MKIGVVDYGRAGNIYNMVNALEAAGADAGTISNADDFAQYDQLVIPGVGAFPDALEEIETRGLRGALLANIARKPTLGICLGMQILCKVGFEFVECDGLGVVDGEVRPIQCKGPVPRMGFGSIEVVRPSRLLAGVTPTDEFYFMHSYEVVNYTDVTGLTSYAEHRYVCAFETGHIFGVQFHPERSREAGIGVLKNFLHAGE